ncbi:MAG: PEP-CTERM sorting domain-containing protein [Pirellulales bacterium]|nr:PEP-CTERM sorting domain-containing protein [Pirellulales bacterium]
MAKQPVVVALSLILGVFVASSVTHPARADIIEFTRITYTGNVVNNAADPVPSLNNRGEAAFRASLGSYNNGQGVYRGSGGPLTVILDTSIDSTFFGGFANYPSINDQGVVAFNARRSGVWGIYSGDGGDLSTIALPPDPYGAGNYGAPGIAEDGTVVFAASTAMSSGIYSSPTFTANSILSSAPEGAIQGISVSGNGRVAFLTSGMSDFAQGAHVTGPEGAGPVTSISELDSLFYGYDSIAVNNDGLVALVGSISFFDEGVYLGNGFDFQTVVDRSGPFDGFGSVSINNQGKIAFFASLDDSGPSGIFLGPDPFADKVIQTGDLLDGSVVTRISFGSQAFNDSGDVAFYALLADGRRGIYVATAVPEPSTIVLGCVGLMAIGAAEVYRRRRENGL